MTYATIRDPDLLGGLIGRRVLEVTQHDEAEWLAGYPAYFMLMFDDGSTLRVVVEDQEVSVTRPRAD